MVFRVLPTKRHLDEEDTRVVLVAWLCGDAE
jgi:hypothetical protein